MQIIFICLTLGSLCAVLGLMILSLIPNLVFYKSKKVVLTTAFFFLLIFVGSATALKKFHGDTPEVPLSDLPSTSEKQVSRSLDIPKDPLETLANIPSADTTQSSNTQSEAIKPTATLSMTRKEFERQFKKITGKTLQYRSSESAKSTGRRITHYDVLEEISKTALMVQEDPQTHRLFTVMVLATGTPQEANVLVGARIVNALLGVIRATQPKLTPQEAEAIIQNLHITNLKTDEVSQVTYQQVNYSAVQGLALLITPAEGVPNTISMP